jgi:hypothetical protein
MAAWMWKSLIKEIDMPDHTEIDLYNYDEFVPEKFERWMRFDDSPPVGKLVPDFPLWNLDRSTTSLKTEITKHAYTIVEFGSFT